MGAGEYDQAAAAALVSLAVSADRLVNTADELVDAFARYLVLGGYDQPQRAPFLSESGGHRDSMMGVRLPPVSVLRDEAPVDDLLLVVRGGLNGLSDVVLDRSVADCWDEHGFFGVSVFAAPGDDLVMLSRANPAIRIRRQVRVARVGGLRAAGFEVAATFSRPDQYSVVLPDASSTTFASLRSCFSDPVENPGYEPDR